MLRLTLVIVTSLLMFGKVTADNFMCYPNRTIHFMNPDSSIFTHFKAHYETSNGTKLKCPGYADSTKDNIYFDCHSSTATMTAYFSDHEFTNDILRGNVKVFRFKCKTMATYNVTLSRDLETELELKHEFAGPAHNITSQFYDAYNNPIYEATVGDTVFFVITGPKEYALKPLECTAVGGADDSETIVLNGCSQDTSLVTSFYKDIGPVNTDYRMTVYVFKFYDSDTLTITCDVKVCPDTGCYFSCGSRIYGLIRNKRQLPDNDSDNSDDNVEMLDISTIGNRLKINGVILGGSIQHTGSLGVTVLTVSLTLFLWGGSTTSMYSTFVVE